MCKHIEEPQQVGHVATQLTFEELKHAAGKLGYTLAKKKTYVPLKPCPICGKKYTVIWYSMVEPRGEFRGNAVEKKSDLNQAWNDAVDKYFKENSND